jgi:hypothetical protein
LVIKILILYQIIISIQYLKLSSKILKYYYLKFILQAETKDDCRVSQAKYSIVIAKKKNEHQKTRGERTRMRVGKRKLVYGHCLVTVLHRF